MVCALQSERRKPREQGNIRVRYAKRRDENEGEIVNALENAGCQVHKLDDIDLLVGLAGKNYLIECKHPKRAKRVRPLQRKLRDNWQGQYAIVTTAEQALRIVGLWI
jgi:hypothetical protein